jgi:hypothetical protein
MAGGLAEGESAFGLTPSWRLRGKTAGLYGIRE